MRVRVLYCREPSWVVEEMVSTAPTCVVTGEAKVTPAGKYTTISSVAAIVVTSVSSVMVTYMRGEQWSGGGRSWGV